MSGNANEPVSGHGAPRLTGHPTGKFSMRTPVAWVALKLPLTERRKVPSEVVTLPEN